MAKAYDAIAIRDQHQIRPEVRIDFRERLNDREEAIRAALDAAAARLHTAMPGIVISYDPVSMTAVVQVAIMYEVRDQAGTWAPVALRPIPDVPVMMAGGGGFSATFPLAPGDEGWLVFAERCIDGWWQSGGIAVQAEHRMHDLSDPAFFPKVRSKPKALNPAPSTTAAQLRSDDGNTYVEVGVNEITLKAATITLQASTQIIMTAPTIKEN
jgi:hypothetical protein